MLNRSYRLLLLLIVIYSIISGVVSADIVVEDVSIKPENPTKLSESTLTANISGINTSDNVTLYIQECDENTGLCDPPFSIEMTKINSDTYSAEFSLKFDTATYFDYWFVVETNGDTTKEYTVRLASNSKDNEDTQNQDNNDNGLPGFELLVFLTAVFIGILFFMKKR